MSGRVAGKRVLITGGAGGLGQAMAWMMAREGARLAISDVDGAAAERLAQAINDEIADAAVAYAHDVRCEEDWARAVSYTHLTLPTKRIV